MKKQFVLVLIALMLITCTAFALDYKVASHTISIQISTEGNDKIIEKYFITFTTNAQKVAFREKSLELGTNLDAWKLLDPIFVPSLGENTLNKRISYNEGEQNYLQISYDLADPLMAKLKESTMVTEYTIRVSNFDSFYHSGQWIILENTTISIELPPGAEIKNNTGLQTTITKNLSRQTINWKGYQTTNELAMSYIVWKQLDPVIDLNAITNFIFKTQEGIILLIISAIIIIAVLMNRKKIYETIENFVEANSMLKEE